MGTVTTVVALRNVWLNIHHPHYHKIEIPADFTVIFCIRVFSPSKLHLLSQNFFSKHSVTYLYWKSTHNHSKIVDYHWCNDVFTDVLLITLFLAKNN